MQYAASDRCSIENSTNRCCRTMPASRRWTTAKSAHCTEQCALFAVVQRRDAGMVRQQRFVEFSIEHLSDAAYCIRPDGRFLYANQAARKVLGYTREELE